MLPSVFLLVASLVVGAYGQESTCSTNSPGSEIGSEWFTQRSSPPFLHIFRDQRITCSGRIIAWRFRALNPEGFYKPIFYVWRQDLVYPPKFTLIKANPLLENPVNVATEWYEYVVPELDRIVINYKPGESYYVGIGYENIADNDFMRLLYLDRLATGGSLPNFGNMANSTIVAKLNRLQIDQMIRESPDNTFSFNANDMSYEMQRPFLQAIVQENSQTTPTTTARTTAPTTAPTTPVATAATTPQTTRIFSLPPAIDYRELVCPGNPTLVNGQVLAKDSNNAGGALYEEVEFQCDPGYAVRGRNSVYCNDDGKWVTRGNCALSSYGKFSFIVVFFFFFIK